MGCTHSTPADDDATRNLMNVGSSRPSPQRRGRSGNSQSLLSDRPNWTASEPMTQAELDAQRSAFWDTAPTYEGRLEVWQALQLVCQPETDHGTAQVVLDSVGVTLPTGLLADGAFDALGNQYVIPDYCLSAPTNLITTATAPSGDGERAAVIATLNESAEATKEATGADTGRAIKLTIRLTTNEDVVLEMHANDQLYPQVTRALLAARPPPECDGANQKEMQVQVRYLRLGRILRGEQSLGELAQPEETSLLLQAMVNVLPPTE